MMARPLQTLVQAASAFAVALALAACTPSGQFDPTELLAMDVLNNKKKLQGEREPLFPSGVPGAETGVPPDLVKGYQAPQQAAAETTGSAAKPAAPAAEATAKLKPKPRPKVARTPAAAPAAAPAAQDPVWGGQRSAAQAQQQHDPVWDQKSPQQSAWPAPQSAAPAQQTAQPAQSVWPNPPSPNTSSR
jgi:hypothetical protein